MDLRQATPQRGSVPHALAATVEPALGVPLRASATRAILWAGAASTLRRLQRGEGALLAVNLSLVVHHGLARPHAFVEALVSVLAIGLMYAFNDLYDAPTDSNNPKKDRALIAVYLDHRRACTWLVVGAKLLTLALALATLDPRATIAVGGALASNVIYSMFLKGVPVVDVVWCGVWGALYAAIVTPQPSLWLLVGLMTAVCHLYQALDDRAADAANAITTTAVRSAALSIAVLATLCALLAATLRPPLGVWAATAAAPLAIYFACAEARTGWLATKVYFGVMWLCVLGVARAAG